MDTHTYLSMIPEALVVSMLPPAQFGTYLATGTQKRSREQAMFFEVNGDLPDEYFALEDARRSCVPHPDGAPKHSVYVSVYRVLEHVPLTNLGDLWLVTRDGRTLNIAQTDPPNESRHDAHLYQELCPLHPTIASSLDPVDFCLFVTNPAGKFSVPEICFAELALGELADDPAEGHLGDLPYTNVEHLRDCLRDLRTHRKTTKTVNRIAGEHLSYRCIQGGFYVGDSRQVRHYPFAPPEAMERDHHDWYRSATLG